LITIYVFIIQEKSENVRMPFSRDYVACALSWFRTFAYVKDQASFPRQNLLNNWFQALICHSGESGIQELQELTSSPDSGFRRRDGQIGIISQLHTRKRIPGRIFLAALILSLIHNWNNILSDTYSG